LFSLSIILVRDVVDPGIVLLKPEYPDNIEAGTKLQRTRSKNHPICADAARRPPNCGQSVLSTPLPRGVCVGRNAAIRMKRTPRPDAPDIDTFWHVGTISSFQLRYALS